MKILYLIDHDPSLSSGVMNKIKSQVSTWVQLGHTVSILSSSTLTLYDGQFTAVDTLPRKLRGRSNRLSVAARLMMSTFLLRKLAKHVDADVIYMRYRLYTPRLLSLFGKRKLIMEINSDDSTEYKLRSLWTHFYNKATRGILLSRVDAFVGVSEELSDRFSSPGKPCVTIANGIDVAQHSFFNNNDTPPKLVFIGTPGQPWHGIDKVEKMAEKFQEYMFYIIGPTGKDTDNLKYLGVLPNSAANEFIRTCDIGIGSLSLHLKGLTEASPLKTRQYLASGLPIIYGYRDTDIPANSSFALELLNCKDNLDFEAIKKFILDVVGDAHVKGTARLFAESALAYRVKEKERISFFGKVVGASAQ